MSKENMRQDGWREIRLGDVVKKVAMGPFGSNIKVETFKTEGIPIISGQHLHEVRLRDNEFNFITEEHANKLSNSNVFRGDVVLTHAGNIGQVSFIPKTSRYDRYVVSQRQFYLRCDQEKIDYEFIVYYFRSPYGQHQILANSSQTGVPSLAQPATSIKNLNIFIPPLPKQKAIAKVLSSLDDKIDLLHHQNKTLEAMAQTLFRKWFVEDADKGWEEKPLWYFGDIICGKTPSKKIHEYFGGNIPFIKIPDMHGVTFIFDTTDTLTEDGKISQDNKTIPPKSICVSCIATVGLVSMNAFESQTNQQINSIIPKKDEYRYFIYLFMKSCNDLLHSMASGGTATMNLNTRNFSKIMVLSGDENLISEFHYILKPVFEKIFSNQSQIRTLEKLRDTLLPKLMNGNVKVKN